MADVSLLSAKFETTFQISFWQNIIERWTQKKTLIRPRSKCFNRIGGMQSAQKYSRKELALDLNLSQSPICHHFKKDFFLKCEHENIWRKRTTLVNTRNIVLLLDNRKPNSVRITQEKKNKLNLDWSVLTYPPYSTDLSPSDFHLFRSLQNILNDKKYSQEDQMKTFVQNILSSKAV